MDGHRACGVRSEPVETLAGGGRCPVCGKPLTIGVAHRVEMLADRKEAQIEPPPTAGTVTSLVPLPEILSEIMGAGVASQSVVRAYDRTVAALGPELSTLKEVPVEDVARIDSLLGEAITRLRAGNVIRQAGYDGEYGVIRLFDATELSRFTRGGLLFDAPASRRAGSKAQARPKPPEEERATPASPSSGPAPSGRAGILATLDADQGRAAEAVEGPLVVIAGPGSGKTRLLTHRLAHLVVEFGVPASSCLAITFTRRATEELQARLAALLPRGAGACTVHSFHSLGLTILREHGAALGLATDFRIADEPERAEALAAAMGITPSKAARLLKAVSMAKRTGAETEGETRAALAALRRLGREQNWVDFDDLVGLAIELLEKDRDVSALWCKRFRYICADEFQDVDELQYRLLHLLASTNGNLCVIGDPNQAIYGFRGADSSCFDRFARDFPAARTVRLGRNYRSTGTIVTAAAQLIGAAAPESITRPMQEPIMLHAALSERAEAEFVATEIERLLGGHDMLSANRPKIGRKEAGSGLGFADFAVLYRTDAQSMALREAFDRAGIPFKKSSPAPLAGQQAVQAVLAALSRQDPGLNSANLSARITAAVEQVRGDTEVDAAALAEARGWLDALGASAQVFGDEARLREQVALSTEADFWDSRADRVSLLTLHAAKGLEFSVVFVVGLEDGLMPFSWNPGAAESGGAKSEERRLFYVAMTRAKDRLFLSRAQQRFWRGQSRAQPPSPFLRDIAEGLTVQHAPSARKPRPQAQQYSLF
jgi:superfamily I DNA/RNA helicase